MARQVEAYGEALSFTLKLGAGGYDESQCSACPHEHRCCNLLVSVTPYEAIGIITWLKTHLPDEVKAILDRVKMRSEAMMDYIVAGKFENLPALADAWYARGIKCAFYDQKESRCSIYPVRPVACRTAYGRGDCGVDGIKTVEEDGDLRRRREGRVRLANLSQAGYQQGELCAVVTTLRTTTQGLDIAPRDQALLQMEPAQLTQEQLLWGLDGPPVANPLAEV